MRSPLLSGVPRHVPAHAQPSRTPAVVGAAATTAGLALALLPAGLLVTAGAAAAAPGAGSRLEVGVPATSDSRGRILTQIRMVRPDGDVAVGERVLLQRSEKGGWLSVAEGRTDPRGRTDLTTSLAGAATLRVLYPGSGDLAVSVSKQYPVKASTRTSMGLAWTATPNVLAASGRLVRTAGPVPNAILQVQRHDGRVWRTVAQARTNAAGVMELRMRMTITAPLRVLYDGSGTNAASASPQHVVRVAAASSLGQRAVAEAAKHYGKAYRYGSAGPSSFDCSGLTSYVFRQLGRNLPHSSAGQASAVRTVPVSAKQVGDLIFTHTGGRVTHVGIFAGGNEMWAATKSGDIIRKQAIYSRNITVGRVG